MGLDRLLMLRKGIPDIRLLRSGEPRVATQMLDLAPYRSVSNLPSMRRDLSVAIGSTENVEELGDRVREALGRDADLIEGIRILSETDHGGLPPAGRQRLGMTTEHKNVLLRLDIRPLERTLTDAEANVLRDQVYAAVHQGARGEWAAGP